MKTITDEQKEIREALGKQLQLLSKRSKNPDADFIDLAFISDAMCKISKLLMDRDPLGRL